MGRRESGLERKDVDAKCVSIVKDVQRGGNDNIKIEDMVEPVKPYCPEDLLNVRTTEGALSRPFNFGEYNSPNKYHVHIRGYVDFYGGYAKHTREVIKGLEQTGKCCIRLRAIPSPRDIDPIIANKMDWYERNPGFKVDGSIFMTIAGPGHLQKHKLPEDNRYKIGWTMIETLDIQPRIVEWLLNVDEVFAPTNIDVDKFKRAGVKNVTHMPLGYDPSYWNPQVKPMDVSNLRNRYVFGVCGSWNVRKSVKEIVQAYVKEFNSRENVTLLFCSKYGTRKWGSDKDNDERWCIKYELEQYIAETGITDVPHIAIMDIPIHPEVMPTICARFDSLVGFSKGESTWLPGLEIGAMKKPIIQLASDCSGFMDYLYGNPYMCKNVSYLEADEELYAGTSEYYEGEKLAHGDVEELSYMMRKIYTERDTYCQRQAIDTLYDRIVHYTWDKSIKLLVDRFSKIAVW